MTRGPCVESALMRRLLVLLSMLALASLGTVVACGGNEKPPLTPDTVEPMPEGVEAGAPAHSAAPSAPMRPPG